ncbi:MAG TPA: 2Fe-2S iron-sulfur cluster-binding protein, partial [Geminicoccaceae bacterium]|nr:2Fe-2S iron-sulfur cluster-binding protein [Geminicoccaceae bacterium]
MSAALPLPAPPEGRAVRFEVNGRPVAVAAPPIKRLADALRDDLGLTGTKIGCNAGDCGACTVLLDGAQVCACMVPLGQAEGRRVTTVEGLADGGRLGPLQAAFQRHGAAQCG